MFRVLGPSLFALVFALCPPAQAQTQRAPRQLAAGEIQQRLEKLGVLGSVLYLAAHPDDENTRLISYLANGRRVRTAYLSLTRGDGGQNLIGPELGDALGILRTQELLEARRIDGGEQFFTRAVDFGYSKNPDETLAKWGREEILADVVRVVRTFRPDVIVTRFDIDGSGGHGHHTASALLAREAFDLAADPQAFPQQIAGGLETWQTRRLFFNASTWWKRNVAEVAKADPEHWVSVDVGGFDPLLGMSFNELASHSRSQHKSQGFGTAIARGSQLEYLRLDKGPALGEPDLLDGVALDWGRVAGGDKVGLILDRVIDAFDPEKPERSAAGLMELLDALDRLAGAKSTTSDGRHWARRKAIDTAELLLHITGTHIEAQAARASIALGESMAVTVQVLQRGAGSAWEWLASEGPGGEAIAVQESLPWNQPLEVTTVLEASAGRAIDQPYWLVAPHGTLYDPRGTGHTGIEPSTVPPATYTSALRLAGTREVKVERHPTYSWVDRVDGELTRAAGVTPPLSIEPQEPVLIVRDEQVQVVVELEALCAKLEGALAIQVPAGWELLDAPTVEVSGLLRGQRKRLQLTLRRAGATGPGVLGFGFTSAAGFSDLHMHLIDYPHIQPQVWYSKAQVRLVPLDVELNVSRIGYVDGAGDDLPGAMQRLGLSVERIDPGAAQLADLEAFDSIVVGIRAYNTVPAMARLQPLLLDYVEAGGTLLVQYNTASRDMVLDPRTIGPYPFSLTRGRVTVEESAPTLLAPEHPLLHVPNEIGPGDFENWVQERGLYFAGSLDPQYQALIAWNDPGEAPLDGALISADFGKGRFIYTGISFFRQLPAGVPGAYRLLANLIARRSPRE